MDRIVAETLEQEPALEPSSTAVPCSLEGAAGSAVALEPVLEPTPTQSDRKVGYCLRLLLVVEPVLEPDKPLDETGNEGR